MELEELSIYTFYWLIFLVCQGISAIGFTEAARTWQGKALGASYVDSIFDSGTCFLN